MSDPLSDRASLPTGNVAILFTDIEGSTALWEQDGARMSRALAAHDALARSAVEGHHGRVVKMTGDGFLAAFDDALDALAATVEMQQALADPAATNGVTLRVRCGLHAGVAERRDNDYFGSPVNRAARIMSAAHGGQVLLSQVVVDGVRDRLPAAVGLRDLGKIRLKDLSTPEHVYQVAHPQLRQDFPALRSLEATPNNLPQQATSFIGREKPLADVRSLLARARTLTLTGSGGCGKTRLCLQVAADSLERFPDGTWLVELAPLADPGLVPRTVATVLGLKEEPGKSINQTLSEHLKDKRLLLLLDNCEHLLDACAKLADALVRQCPGVQILATSREGLGIGGEQAYRVPSLSLPDPKQVHTPGSVAPFEAVQLFIDRAMLARADFQVTDQNASMIVSICYRLDGIPLAIELAAARVRSLSVEEINRKLDERFRLLTRGSSTALPRQQTLRNTLEWSHNLLNDAERAVFRRLAVFAGGFTMEMAQAVAGDTQLNEWAVLDHLSALVEKSLVVADAGDEPRYRLLESARAFALDQMTAGETADVLKRHALAMWSFLERVDNANLDGELRTDRYAVLVLPELDNLRAAHTWATSEIGDVGVAIAIAAHAGSLIDYAIECADWLPPLKEHVEDGATSPALTARYWRAIAASNMSPRVPRTLQVEAAYRARSLYQALGLPRRVFSSLIQLARHRNALGHDAAAQAALDEARALLRPDWPVEFRIVLLRIGGHIALSTGQLDEALTLGRDSVRVSAATGDWRLEVMARHNLGNVLWTAGPIEEAAREACKLAEDVRARPAANNDMAVLYANLVGILSEAGRIDDAWAAASEALPIMHRAHAFYLEEWIYLFWRRGQIDTAALLLGALDAVRLRTAVPLQVNELRLMAEARPALEALLRPEALSGSLAAGAALGESELFALISEALAQPSGNRR